MCEHTGVRYIKNISQSVEVQVARFDCDANLTPGVLERGWGVSEGAPDLIYS